MAGAHRAEGVLEKREHFLHPMAQLQTRQLKLTGDFTHIFAGSSEEVDAALREFCGFGLREIAPIADHNAVFEPACEGVEQLTIIDGGGGEIEGAEPPSFITLPGPLKALPPAPPVLRFPRPLPERARLARPRHVAASPRRGILQDTGIRPLRLPMALPPQGPPRP